MKTLGTILLLSCMSCLSFASSVKCQMSRKPLHRNTMYLCYNNAKVPIWVLSLDDSGYIAVTVVLPNVGLAAYVPLRITPHEQDYYNLGNTGQFVRVKFSQDSNGDKWVRMDGAMTEANKKAAPYDGSRRRIRPNSQLVK